MNKMTLLRVLGTVLLITAIFLLLDLNQLVSTLAKLHWGWWLLAFTAQVMTLVLGALRWQTLAKPLGFQHPYSRYLRLGFSGAFFNQILPTSLGGDVTRGWMLAEKKEQRAAAFLSIFADRVSGLILLVALCCCAALFVPLPTVLQYWMIALACGTIGGVVCTIIFIRWSYRSAPSEKIVGRPFVRPFFRIFNKLKELMEGYEGRLARFVPVLFLAFLIQSLNVFVVWFLAQGMGLSIPLSYCFVFVPLVSLIAMLPLGLGGLGPREWGMWLLLSSRGFSLEQRVTLSLLWFSVLTVIGLLGGVVHVFGTLSTRSVDPATLSMEGVDATPETETRHAA